MAYVPVSCAFSELINDFAVFVFAADFLEAAVVVFVYLLMMKK
jgi:hypothetical protein